MIRIYSIYYIARIKSKQITTAPYIDLFMLFYLLHLSAISFVKVVYEQIQISGKPFSEHEKDRFPYCICSSV